MSLNKQNVMNKIIKYIILGLGVSSIIYYVPKNKLDSNNILIITILIVLLYSILDTMSKSKCIF